MKVKKRVVVLCAIIFLSGLGIMLYPFISNYINQKNASRAIVNYDNEIANMSEEEIDVIKEAAEKYNEQLENAVSTDELDKINYSDITESDIVIGYIVIPKIDVNLPIYSGTGSEVLRKGVGHMRQTSYPVGGTSTHSVLTGHRGLPSATLFTDLDKLEIGDEFYLHVLDEVLAYQVDKVKVVDPNDSSDLNIVSGEDYCTLVTCTPYAINSHRLLVRGTRVEYKEGHETGEDKQLKSGAFTKRIVDVWPWLLISFLVIAVIEVLIFIIMVNRKRKKKKEEREEG